MSKNHRLACQSAKCLLAARGTLPSSGKMDNKPKNELPKNNIEANNVNTKEDPLPVTGPVENRDGPEEKEEAGNAQSADQGGEAALPESNAEPSNEANTEQQDQSGTSRASSESEESESPSPEERGSLSSVENLPQSETRWSPISRNTEARGSRAARGTIGTTRSMISEPDFEGEVARSPREEDGSTLLRARYEQSKKGYEELSKNLQDATTSTVLRLCAILKSYNDSKPKPSSSKLSEASPEAQVMGLEKNLKTIQRHIAESRRDQANLLSNINDLEVTMFKWQEAEFLREFMDKIPTEEDLRKIEFIKAVMMERKRLEKEIQKLNSEIKTINKTLENADVIISDSGAIKKTRRVVIRTQSTELAESNSDFAYQRGKQQNEEKSGSSEKTSPEPTIEVSTSEMDDLEKKNGSRRGDNDTSL